MVDFSISLDYHRESIIQRPIRQPGKIKKKKHALQSSPAPLDVSWNVMIVNDNVWPSLFLAAADQLLDRVPLRNLHRPNGEREKNDDGHVRPEDIFQLKKQFFFQMKKEGGYGVLTRGCQLDSIYCAETARSCTEFFISDSLSCYQHFSPFY